MFMYHFITGLHVPNKFSCEIIVWYFQFLRLEVKFIQCKYGTHSITEWFQGYPTDKPVNPMYRTSNFDYGSRAPSVHTMPTMFFARSQQFSQVWMFTIRIELCGNALQIHLVICSIWASVGCTAITPSIARSTNRTCPTTDTSTSGFNSTLQTMSCV